ncbi:MAG: peptidase M23 [Paracoccus denitrificans]|nr:MAG: peptidase M23 [Paracoccus denitrificans]PZO84904.1 MAG: peptidase M23 [Paracoccus denitrificans]
MIFDTRRRAWVGAIGAAALLAACTPQGGVAVNTPQVNMDPGPLARMSQSAEQSFAGLRIPGITVNASGAGAGTAGGAAPVAGQAQVRDPFAGQGVKQTAVPGAPAGGVTVPAATITVNPNAAAASAAPSATAPAAAPAAAAARVHTVAAGETAWSVARKYGVTIQDLARANGLPESMSIRTGQRLNVPAAGAVVASNQVTAPGAGSPTPEPPSAAKPLPSETTVPASKPIAPSQAPDLGKTRTAASGSGRFAMPVAGSISRAYAKGRNEGIDISAAPGAPVKAAGSGTVAAVTRDTEGTPIVVVRHSDNMLTVYAGIDGLAVEKGQQVKAGQQIGKARNSGPVHFEVRNGFESVDPEKYLN